MIAINLAKSFICGTLFLSVLILQACSHHEVDTWEEWCEQISGVDLAKKYNKWGLFFSVRHNADAIRKDFVEKYNLLVLADVGSKYLAGAKPDSKVMQELARLKIVGVWCEGNSLHIANSLLIKDHKMEINEFPEFVEKYRFYLNLKANRNRLDEFQYCLFGTINSLFDTVILHGPDKADQVAIKVEHSLKQ
jgi:hypothetical protein